MDHHSIIAAVDGSERDAGVVAFARVLAATAGAPLVVATVHPKPHGAPADTSRALRAQAEALLAGAAAAQDPTIALAGPSPAWALHDLAARNDARALVVGTAPHAARVGGTATRLLHVAGCPVAVVPPGPRAQSIGTLAVAYRDDAEGAAVLDAACTLARLADAGLRIVTVVQPVRHVLAGILTPEGTEMVLEVQCDRAQTALDAAVEHAAAHGVRAEPQLRVGTPADELASAAQGCDVLVCGSPGYGPHGIVGLGGVTARLLRDSLCPVLVLPRGLRHPFPHVAGDDGRAVTPDPPPQEDAQMSETHTSSPIVVVGCDGSDTARAALALAAEHARSGGKLFCVHAYALPDGWMTPRSADLMLQEGMRRGEEVLAEARAAAEAVLDPDAIETELIGGNAAKVIVDVATVRGADEIIVGTRGFGRARALLGSVSHELIHLAPCPVTVIPDPERVADRAAAAAEGSAAAAP